MQKVRVGVLRGGPSSEYEVSLQTGAAVIRHLDPNLYDVYDILISRDGVWYMNGLPIKPLDAVLHVDVVFNALHGHFGEDGKLQHFLEQHKIPFTGSGSFASALGMNKSFAKDIFKKEGIKTPYYKVANNVPQDPEEISNLFRAFSPPLVVKPVSGGSSIDVSLANTLPKMLESISKIVASGDSAMIEEYIPGVEASVGVIDGYRDKEFYVLPPVEIRPYKDAGKTFFDYDAKYNGMSEEIVPGNFSPATKAELEELAARAHKALGLRHYSRTDFIISPRRGIFVLETNTQPGLTEESLFPKALHAVGSTLSHFFDHLINLALGR